MTTDRIKEELQWLRAVLPVLAAIVAGLIAYAVQPTTVRAMSGVSAGMAVVGLAGVAAVVTRVYRLLKHLE